MTKEGLLEPGELIAFHDGTLSDPDVVAHIRSSVECKNWLKDYRLLRILANDQAQQAPTSELSLNKITEFYEEQLSTEEARNIEETLASDPRLFDDYLSVRLEQLAAEAAPIPKELDDRVLRMLMSSAKETESAAPIEQVKPQSNWSAIVIKYIFELVSFNRLAWLGGLAAASLIIFIGGKQIGFIGAPEFSPLVVASLEQGDPTLTFRGGGAIKKAATVRDGKLSSIEFVAGTDVLNAVLGFGQKSTKETFAKLIESINGAIDGLPQKNLNELGSNVRFRADSITAIQIQPALWKLIQSGSTTEYNISFSLEKKNDPDAPISLRKSKGPPILNILYLSSAN